MKWDSTYINVFLDLSTYCNAGCPQCHRTCDKGLGKEDWLPLMQWSLDEFKKAFPPEEIVNVAKFHICGTWGDPMMNKDILEICKYIVSVEEATCKITIDTNGSLRSEDFWWNIGSTLKSRLTVRFMIDGINQDMHSMYRRFTNLDTVLENMTTLSMTPAIVESQTILFKHNCDYKDEIKQIAIDHGSTEHEFVISDRFEGSTGDTVFFVDDNGVDFSLQQAPQEVLPNGVISGLKTGIITSDKIVCRWAKPRNEIVINPDGQVHACCFHANRYFYWQNLTDLKMKDSVERHMTSWFDEYKNNEKQYNVFYRPLSQIMNDDWFTKTLHKSIVSDNPINMCSRHCSNKIKKFHQLREKHAT